MSKPNRVRIFQFAAALLCLFSFFELAAVAQTKAERAQANELIRQNKFLEALPILEKMAANNPADANFWAYYAMAVYSRSQTLETSEARRRERLAARALALKAQKLGSGLPIVMELLETIPEDGETDDGFSDDPKLEAALREGEAHFGRGDYDKAFTAYQNALKIDPKNYLAMVFSGDCFYAKQEYAKSESWFAKAAALEPDREIAFRFWGDALALQEKTEAARDKYIEAIVAEPYGKLAWEKLQILMGENGYQPTTVAPPGGKIYGTITIDEKMFKADDGTINWRLYRTMRETWQKQGFKQKFPAEKTYRHTLSEETAALRIVAEAAKTELQKGTIKKLDQSLDNLIKINDAGLLEAYVLIVRSNDEILVDYEDYRRKSRAKIKLFINDFIVGVNNDIY